MPGGEYGQYGQYHNYVNTNHFYDSSSDMPQLQAGDLKICDLCGALNLAENTECFVCRWKGHFEQRADVVKIAMELMERRHGHLELSLLTSEHVYRKPRTSSGRTRARQFFLRLQHWFFG